MTGRLQRNTQSSGLFIANRSMEPVGDGNFTPGDLVEDPNNPGYFLFNVSNPTPPELTYLPAMGNGSYGPRVEVLIREFPYAIANLWRITDGDRVLVRGGVERQTSGGLLVVDSEVPFGVSVTYQAGVEFEDGSVVYSEATTITLDREVMGPDYGKAFVHNVLEPSRAMEHVFTGDALGALTSGNTGGTYTPEGAQRALWMGAGESGLYGVNLSGSTYTLEDERLFREMFGTRQVRKLPILVFRGPPELLLPGTFFAVVQERTRVPHNVASGLTEWVEWRMTGDEVEPPFPGLAEPVVTWSDIAARFPGPTGAVDYGDAYATFLDIARDYSLVGLADNN